MLKSRKENLYGKIREFLKKAFHELARQKGCQIVEGYMSGDHVHMCISYYRVQEFKKIFNELDGFIRSRLRSIQLKKWKKPKKFQRMMIRAGYPVQEARRTWVKMNKWQSVSRTVARFVLNLKWFRRQQVVFLDDFTQRQLKLKFAR
jgi:REP element-mobilizing transposase RayT